MLFITQTPMMQYIISEESQYLTLSELQQSIDRLGAPVPLSTPAFLAWYSFQQRSGCFSLADYRSSEGLLIWKWESVPVGRGKELKSTEGQIKGGRGKKTIFTGKEMISGGTHTWNSPQRVLRYTRGRGAYFLFGSQRRLSLSSSSAAP